MKQFTLRLNKENQRPVVTLKDWHKFAVMIDTGALFPVWVGDSRILEKLDAEVLGEKVKFGGFGGAVYGTLYKIPYFKFGELIYPGLHIIAHKLGLPCHMIVSATMLQDMMYEIDARNHKLNVTIPADQSNVRNLVIRRKNGTLEVLCTSMGEGYSTSYSQG